jgi:hypothetical protein
MGPLWSVRCRGAMRHRCAINIPGSGAARLRCVVQALVISVCFANGAFASTIYKLVSYPTLQNGYTLTGTITTDGHVGVLAYSDITDASLTASNGTTTYQTPHASEVYGVTNLIATATELDLPLSNLQSFPHFKIGGAGFGTPQLQYDYIQNADNSIVLYSNCVVDHPTTLTVLWNTSPGSNLLQLNGEPWRIATAVPEPAALILLVGGAAGLLVVGRVQKVGIRSAPSKDESHESMRPDRTKKDRNQIGNRSDAFLSPLAPLV